MSFVLWSRRVRTHTARRFQAKVFIHLSGTWYLVYIYQALQVGERLSVTRASGFKRHLCILGHSSQQAVLRTHANKSRTRSGAAVSKGGVLSVLPPSLPPCAVEYLTFPMLPVVVLFWGSVCLAGRFRGCRCWLVLRARTRYGKSKASYCCTREHVYTTCISRILRCVMPYDTILPVLDTSGGVGTALLLRQQHIICAEYSKF